MERQAFEAWLEGYLKAWNSNDHEDIGRLFAEEALYYTGPFDEPWRGRDGIVAGWLGRKDEPGSFSFRYEILATDVGVGVARGWTTYREPPREYSNIWVVRFDEQGRCTEFTEWWVERT